MKKFAISVAILSIGFSTSIHAQWVRANGPYSNGYLFHFLMFGNQLFAGGTGGVFVSGDNGITWSPRNTGLLPVNYRSLGIFDSILFAGSDEGQVFRSNDHGLHWTSSSSGLPSGEWISDFLQVGKNFYVCSDSGLYLSTDSGSQWQSVPLKNDPRKKWILSIAQVDTELFVGGWGNIYRSTDSGVTWTILNNGIGSESVISSILPASGKIFAGATDSGLYVSTDDGNSWHGSVQGIPTYNSVRRIMPFGTSLLAYNGVLFRSTDSGASWILLDTTFDRYISIDMILNGTRLITAGGFYSDDTAKSWDTIHAPFFPLNIASIASSENTLIAGAEYGSMFVSSDNGLNWTAIGPPVRVLDLKALGTDFVAATMTGIILSSDNGKNWVTIDSSTDGFQLATIGTTLLLATTSHGLFYSRDTGTTWQADPNLLGNNTIHGIFAQGSMLFAWTDSGTFRSTGPQQWIEADSGLGQAGQIVAMPNGDLFALADGYLFCSTDSGNFWNYTKKYFPHLTAFGSYNNKLYVGFDNISAGGTLVSTDEGQTWDTIHNGPYYDNHDADNEGNGDPSMIEGAGGYLFINAWEKGLYRLSEEQSIVHTLSPSPMPAMEISNVPNPFSIQTMITFFLDKPSIVYLSVFDMRGCEHRVIEGVPMVAGQNHIVWNCANFPSGIYTVRIETGEHRESSQMILLK